MSVALRGNLADFGIGEVFQLIGQQRKTGILEISNEAARVQLLFDAGAIVSAAPIGDQPGAALGEMLVRRGVLPPEPLASALAECASSLEPLGRYLVDHALVSRSELDETEEFLTSETLFDLLRENRGSFHFAAQPVPHERDPASLLAAEEVLMEGLRKVDEWRSFSRALPPEDAVLRRRRGFESYVAKASDEARKRIVTAERVYLLVDGRLTFRRAIDLSRLGTFEASRIVADLIESGVIEPSRRKVASAAVSTPENAMPKAALVAGGVALAVLAAIAVVLHGIDSSPVEALVVASDPLVVARESFEARRLRNGVDAHRALYGDGPGDLQALAEASGGALTPPKGSPYYYRRSGNGTVLLRPER
ncbi:hypothetical protein MYXO_02042 [Myxococcaceae bacterium]|jgi:hypothetical protein|nr:hypothetical protein MYXO_02042 [Myxococcaceae bacterium]